MVSTPFNPGRPISHQHHVRAKTLGELYRIAAVFPRANHAKTVCAAQNGPDYLAPDRVFIHEEHV